MRRSLWTRVSGLVTMVFMAHLTLVGSDLACASHSHGAMGHSMAHGMPGDMAAMSPTASHDVDAGASHEVADAGQSSASDTPPCEVPATDHCCDAMAGCAVTLVVDHAAANPAITGASARVVGLRTNTPSSRLTAPEPPPPKA